jgi:beta-glucanase (GH16 family)
MVSSLAWAVPPAPGAVFDDFEDGDTTDWGFFGGNAAGGGGGPLGDRPQDGSFYFSTGWGGEGTDSGFYGGMFRNLPDGAQVTLPADPWLNVWVLNQSDATVDSYNLEITIREDLDGNGWTNGSEDSLQLVTSFNSAAFNDEWTLVSAPVSSFTNLVTGGDGTFNGNLDELVIAFGGVTGVVGSTIEADFDQIVFTSGGPAAFEQVVFDDMEHGDPFGNGWFVFPGAVGGGGIGANSVDLPPQDGGVFSLETGWGSGGVSGFYGGFGRGNPSDLSGTLYFNFWINPDGGQEYTLEINLQDDDNFDGAISPSDDDEFQFNCVISPAGPCAVSGGGWQLVSIPLADFFDDNSNLVGGNGVLDPTPLARGGNGQLINVVMAVIGGGSDVNFRTDYWSFTQAEPGIDAPPIIIDDFESGIAPATPCPSGALPLGYCTFFGAGSTVALTDSPTPPAPVLPAVGEPNTALQMDVNVTSFAGFIHGFSNPPALDAWIPQDWSTSEGISFWMYGSNSGTPMFIDVLDNRNPGSTTDDAERWTVPFIDDFTGWQLLQFPFSAFVRKEIGNGAPNDGFNRFQVHGYAIGTLNTGGPRTFYVDDVKIYGVTAPPPLSVRFSEQVFFIEEGTTGDVSVKLNRPMGASDPAQVSIDFTTEPAIAVPGEDYTPTSGTLTFVNGGPTELGFPVETFDNTKFTGGKRIGIRLGNPVDVERGPLFQGSILIDENDPYDPRLIDDFERGAFLLDGSGQVALDTQRVEIGGPDERPGQDVVENVLAVSTPAAGPGFQAQIGDVAGHLAAFLPTGDKKADTALEEAIEKLDDALDPKNWVNGFILDEKDGRKVFDRLKDAVKELEKVVKEGGAAAGAAQDAIDELLVISASLALNAIDIATGNGGDPKMTDKALDELAKAEKELGKGKPDRAIDHFGKAWDEATKSIKKVDEDSFLPVASVVRDFAIGQDWTGTESLNFWFRGTGSGEEITVVLKDNRAPDPGPSGWSLVWSDEFNGPAGAPPDPANWSYELGDVNPGGSNGWGNEELQYYTDDTDNVATDGSGNLVITVDAADGSRECYYGPCEFESGRLVTQHKAEFAYGRIEARILVPDGSYGLWPAFWSLGADIARTPWPAAGEIDYMEYVSRIPNEIFGTIHGPGYSSGGAFGNIFDFGGPVADDYHTYAVEWEPDLIRWYVDDIPYHQAEPADVPGDWVFNKPFFMLLNLAIGGNFGGAVDPGLVLPQDYFVDYVRVYQGPDSAERFEATFTDSSNAWQLVSIPLTGLVRSLDQPAGAPDDGLTLNEVWGYGFELPYPAAGTFLFDEVRTIPIPPPSSLTVTNLNDSGPGSLREAIMLIADGGTITFDPALAGGILWLGSGQLAIDRSVTIDGSGAAPLTISGNNAHRVLRVGLGATVAISDLTIADGAGAPRGGGILNLGSLSLERVAVTNNTETSGGPANFELGGGGIYNGGGSTLNLIDSTVSNNATVAQPAGGIYAYFNSTVNITGSTISNNVAADVAGGLRSLGNVTVLNSTFSGNTSTAWHGGGIFHTDGNLTVTHSTFSGNFAPPPFASGIVVADFGAPASATLTGNVLEGSGGAFACALEGGAGATINSGGGNVISDGSCNPGVGDLSLTDALLGPLADNGGATFTHALGDGSLAIDFAGPGACPATDQRGVTRPQGLGCDSGSVEQE